MKIFIQILCFILLLSGNTRGQNIYRFVHMGSEDGLSQNTAFSILFDSKGFMWVGTMNGLNRYDGYEFKIYRSSTANPGSFTNNRVVKLWEDRKNFIWLETYDGYYHCFNPENELFTSIPPYEGLIAKNVSMRNFLQYSDEIILTGCSYTGLYILNYSDKHNTYNIKHYTSETLSPISGNSIRFIYADNERNIWVGTSEGLNFISKDEIIKKEPSIRQFFKGTHFTSVCETKTKLWFGTGESGIKIFNKKTGEFYEINSENTPGLISNRINNLYQMPSGGIIVGFENKGIAITDSSTTFWKKIPFHGKNISNIYEDRFGKIWITAVEFGVTKLDPSTLTTKYYKLTPDEIVPLTDLERPQFYEDTYNNLWIGLHGGGLALYNREKDIFEFFRNNPEDRNSISSNFVHCITEDRNGQLWLGTGQVLGGIEKVILKSPAFDHYMPVEKPFDILDNVARAIHEDRNRMLWVATKAGRIHIFDSTFREVFTFTSLPGTGPRSLRNTVYSIFNDKQGYLWIGSKGHGISVSKTPLPSNIREYKNLIFRHFEYIEDDSLSLSNNNIYSICQDKLNNIWIGTYGNGINLIKNPHGGNIKFIRINQENSNLSSNLVRHLMVDSSGNLWIATALGLNLLTEENIRSDNYKFVVFTRNPADSTSLTYNDIIHIYEDFRGNIWFGTFGGGVNKLEYFDGINARFRHYGPESDPGLGIIFGILGDNSGNIWLSTENGIVCLNPETGTSEIYNTLSGLGFNSFSENTCCLLRNGNLVFGGNLGIEVIKPVKIVTRRPELRIELTRLMLFNQEVQINGKDSPIDKSISFLTELRLKHFQSSFSIDYSALDLIDPEKIKYSYKLDNFENTWNNVGNQHRATYTNLPPGNYVFRVKSISPDGKFTSQERILNITISPPWWKTTAAYGIYAIFLVIITVAVYNTISRINRYKNQLAVEKKINELKLQFFTNISHEIRTPLTLIIGPLEDLLADKSISPKQKLQMEIMLKNARRMHHLTTQLLDFRKVQDNKMELKIKEIDIVSFTKEIFETFQPLAQHKGITCLFSSEFSSFKIFADPDKLDTIIYNIISNAIKFTGTSKKVSVRIEESEKKNFIDIAVTDEGPGIPEENLTDIFTRYTILSNKDLAGTGIGLALSYELARLHGGEILISSEVGKGSIFTIRLLKGKEHLLQAGYTEIAESSEFIKGHPGLSEQDERKYKKEIIPISEISGKNVMLIVEDNLEILNYISQSLKSHFACIGAKDGHEGLHLARTTNPDIIVTDIRMPGIDGMEMTRLLKEDFNTCHIPVIMVTSKSDMKDQIEGIETGAEAYIVKPFNMEYLKTVACNLINQRNKVIRKYLLDKQINGAEEIKVTSKDEEFLGKVVAFIKENYSTEFSIDKLAETCSVSRTVLYNKIKGLTGLSPLEFIRKVKLNIAAQLLEYGFNVSEAAYKTGFSDVKYFSKLFKAQFGYRPSKHKSNV